MNPQTRLPDAGEHGVDLTRVDALIMKARAALNDNHLHPVLLTEGRRLAGTLTRTDLPPPGTIHPALAWATLVDLPNVCRLVAMNVWDSR